ncbi:hypothetical protein JXB12_11395 [candidate division KSB1 bacterium]|nr:hypothetical protein [candidate division KSB1 bacterium]
MNLINKQTLSYLKPGIILILILISCAEKQPPEPEEQILVRIGDTTISVDEFVRRAEYTVRPPYCRGNHNLDKKIVLNSLIAEKLMAIEASDTNAFISSNRIQTYLRGRKEQVMRQWLYEKEAMEKVELDTAQIKKTMRVAGRKYRIAYFNLPDSNLADQVYQKVRVDSQAFEDVYFELTGLDTLPQREVEWSGHEHDLVLDSLYSEPLIKNQVVGPLNVGDNQYLMVKIMGWIDRPTITNQMVQDRWRNVTDEYTQREAVKLYDDFILKVMKGKTIEFMPDTFYKITDLLGPIYLQTDAEKKEMLKKSYWEQDEDIEKYQDLQTQIEILYDEPLLKFEGQVWTVQDFANELNAHPLVFRNNRIKNNEFGQELQFAIMDMIRDKYLANEAYKRGYDKINVIRRNVSMWQDNLNYQYYKNELLKKVLPDTVTEMNYIQLIDDYLNDHVDSLQSKYTDVIEIDIDAYEAIKLTRIDMSVTQKNVPFVKVVPSFPLVTTDNKLDYGKKMNDKEN